VEQLIADYSAICGLFTVIFRYFNVAGADLGENNTPETHLIPLVLDAMIGSQPYLQIFGDGYPTPDGTCIRDYIHVADLADAHVLGLQKLFSEGGQHAFNLSNGIGTRYSR
jgi:UDP-glucose 4-epimerase